MPAHYICMNKKYHKKILFHKRLFQVLRLCLLFTSNIKGDQKKKVPQIFYDSFFHFTRLLGIVRFIDLSAFFLHYCL